MPRHNKRPPVLVRGEPQLCGGLLSSLAIDSRGLASRTCPRIDPIERAIAHSCAGDWRRLNFANSAAGSKCSGEISKCWK